MLFTFQLISMYSRGERSDMSGISKRTICECKLRGGPMKERKNVRGGGGKVPTYFFLCGTLYLRGNTAKVVNSDSTGHLTLTEE